jgi:alpha-glucosidase (family GH31 glycosyl hydrolase)
MQSYGSDVGGFGGPLPDPELFVRWVQLGVTHSRFCIHSYKPDARDRSGAARDEHAVDGELLHRRFSLLGLIARPVS